MIIVTALPNDLVVCKDNPGLSVGRPLLDTGKKMIIAAFLSVGLMGQEAGPPIITPVNPEAAEAVAAFVGLGRYAGTCAAHLPAGAKARLDGLTSDQAPPGVPTWLVSGFRQGYKVSRTPAAPIKLPLNVETWSGQQSLGCRPPQNG